MFKNIGLKGWNWDLIAYFRDMLQIDVFVPVLNVLIFIPMGALMRFRPRILCYFIIFIFCIEGLQYLLSLGFFDIGDIVTNTVGFVIGNGLNPYIQKYITSKS
ncbi:VanZ family protein [Streptococcus cameli]